MTNQPASPEAEAALLGAILIDGENLNDIGALAGPDFYLHAHRFVWEAICACRADNLPVDFVTVTDALERAGHLAEVGGAAFLAGLLNAPADSTNASGYAEIVRRESLRRRLLESATGLAKDAYSAEDPAEAAQIRAAELQRLASGSVAAPVTGIDQAVNDWYDSIAAFLQSGKLPGLSTGFAAIDRGTQGLKRKELMILAARPSMGKTSLAATISVRQARAGLRVGVFTLEDSTEGWMEAAALAHLGIDKLHAGPDALARISDYCAGVYGLPMRFYEQGYSSMAQIDAAAHQMERELGGLDVLWVDHLGYINHLEGADRRAGNLPYVIGQTTKRLAKLAKDFDCAVACLCQLSRDSAKENREPQLTDLRDSGEIEQDARQVWFIHRPGYYADPEPPDNLAQEARLLVRKNHKGPTGLVPLVFVKNIRRFAEVAK